MADVSDLLYVVEAKSESREAKEALSDCGISERAHCRQGDEIV